MNCNRMRYGRLLIPSMLVGCIAVACSTDECEGNRNALPLAGFYSTGTSTKKISIDSVTIYGVGAPGDSMLVNNGSNLSQVYLPFRIDEPSTTFVIQYNQKELAALGIEDKITFRYTQEPVFVSSACGVSYQYNIDKIEYTRNIIDSVACPGGVITNANKENLLIYFRAKTE